LQLSQSQLQLPPLPPLSALSQAKQLSDLTTGKNCMTAKLKPTNGILLFIAYLPFRAVKSTNMFLALFDKNVNFLNCLARSPISVRAAIDMANQDCAACNRPVP
jgi:hypothetical protein